ncbi:MAG TPA: acetyl-CoA decarbonylase/synthase complex subunit delta [Candidatus Gastranaerophilales bacterium]|nr:acetyl-CoA decarbonylase/synthase complex subunit delta [Candidatus Gastranaerophilales bacterium]
METEYKTPNKAFKSRIMEIDLNGVKTGGESSLMFMNEEAGACHKPLIACEILTNIPANYPELLKQAWQEKIYDPLECVKFAEASGFELLAIRFNIENCSNTDYEIEKSKEQLKEILSITQLPLIITGSFKRDLDIKLLSALAESASRKCTIGVVEEENYKQIAPTIRDCGHNIIARTPIDINLTKQLNILLTELGFNADRILIDPNTGSLGYGLDYAYSIIERIKLAALNGDAMLNMPVITFVGEEAWKTKEAKSSNVPEEWGDLNTRAILWESATASSMLASGSNIVVMRHPQAINHIKNFINRAYKN